MIRVIVLLSLIFIFAGSNCYAESYLLLPAPANNVITSFYFSVKAKFAGLADFNEKVIKIDFREIEPLKNQKELDYAI